MITKEMMSDFRKEFDMVSDFLKSKYGFNISLGTIRYDETGFKATINGILPSPKSETVDTENDAVLYGADAIVVKKAKEEGFDLELSPKGFIGSIYRIPGKKFTHTVTGLLDPSLKYFILEKAASGTPYKADIAFFKNATVVGHV